MPPKSMIFVYFFLDVTASQQETQLFKDLGIPERYNTLVRPAPSPTQPLDLVLGLTMQQIIDVVIFYF